MICRSGEKPILIDEEKLAILAKEGRISKELESNASTSSRRITEDLAMTIVPLTAEDAEIAEKGTEKNDAPLRTSSSSVLCLLSFCS